MNNQEFSPAMRWGIGFLILLGVVIALWLGRQLFLPAVISLMLTCVLWPAVHYLHNRWKLPRPIAGVVAIAGLVALCTLAILWGVSAIQHLVQDLPRSYEEQRDAYDDVRYKFEQISPVLAGQLMPAKFQESVFSENINQFVDEQKKRVPGYLQDFLGYAVLILFLVLFMILEGDMLMRRTVEIFGPDSAPDSQPAKQVLWEMSRQIRNYLVWRSLINFFMAAFLGVVYSRLGLKQPWTWAILSGVLTFVPYLGPVVAGVPALIDAFLTQNLGVASIIFVIYVLVLLAEGYVIFPLVLGRNMEMNATTVMLSCLFWWVVWGEIGLFLALPLMAGIKAICHNVPELHPWANLMGTERMRPLPPPK